MQENQQNKKSILVPVLIVLLLISAFVSGSLWQKVKTLEEKEGDIRGEKAVKDTSSQPQVNIEDLKKLFTKDYLSFGSAENRVLFVEFSDPSCPYCHAAAGTNPQLNQQIGQQFLLDTQGGSYIPPVREMRKLVDQGDASYVWLYRNGHGNGELASQALYCAYEKGKFWEVHDLLMSSQGYKLINNEVKNDKTKISLLVDFLKNTIDSVFLKNCLETGKYIERLSRDTKIGDDLGVSGTPGFFVNTISFPGAYSYKEMESVVSSALGK